MWIYNLFSKQNSSKMTNINLDGHLSQNWLIDQLSIHIQVHTNIFILFKQQIHVYVYSCTFLELSSSVKDEINSFGSVDKVCIIKTTKSKPVITQRTIWGMKTAYQNSIISSCFTGQKCKHDTEIGVVELQS